MNHAAYAGLLALTLGWLSDKWRAGNHVGTRRRRPGSHRDPSLEHARRALLSGLHRPDMFGKVVR